MGSPELSAVREVLQWVADGRRIKAAREVELGKAPKNKLTEYKAAAVELQTVGKEAIEDTLAKVKAIDEKEHLKRIAASLEKWSALIEKERAARGKDPDFIAAAKLVEEAGKAGTPAEQQRLLAAAWTQLGESKVVGQLPHDDLPAVPKDPAPRVIDPELARQALQRHNLRHHVRREDTWGNFDAKKALGKDATEGDLKVLLNIVESAMAEDREDAEWAAYEKQTTDAVRKRRPKGKPFTVYKEVILGAGASAAYYIASNYAEIDIPNTMVLGKLQPWAGERGATGKVNHPHNMIDPQQGAQAIAKDEDGLAERAAFSKRIAEVIDKVPYTECTIDKVSRCEGGFFEIDAGAKGFFYARLVTNAMGIGRQKEPPGDVEAEAKPHVKDMDAFKKSLDDGKPIRETYKDIKSIGVIGGNAAIDVITTVLRDPEIKVKGKLEIHWLVGDNGLPAFLSGTDNALAAEDYPEGNLADKLQLKKDGMTVYKGRMTNASGKGPVTVQFEATLADKNLPKHKGAFTVDLVVYGIGPDSEEMQERFADETQGGTAQKPKTMTLQPVFDKDRHYNIQPEETRPEELVKKLAKRMPTDPTVAKKFLDYLKDPSLEGVKGNDDEVRISVKSKDEKDSKSTMQFVGASAARLKTEDDKGPHKSQQSLATPQHETIKTLPENVVGNDQLAASRSRVEAQLNALPTSKDDIPLVTRPGGVNFITANQTVIRVHIAECYPNIPVGLGDYVTGQIIHARSLRPDKNAKDKPKTPIPVPGKDDPLFEHLSLDEQKAFQAKWTERLGEMNEKMLPA